MPTGARDRVRRWVAVLVLTAVPLTSAVLAAAQSMPQLTLEQRQMLESMSPAQRNALIRRYTGASATQYKGPAAATSPAGALPATEAEAEPAEAMDAPTLSGGETVTLVLDVMPAPVKPLSDDDEALMERVNLRNPYRLDRAGRLSLPGLKDIVLAGLSEEQARIRLDAEPALAPFAIEFHVLPVIDPAEPEVEAFGYGVFTTDPQRFALEAAVPVPRDYTVGPGDLVHLQFYGTNTAQYSVEVDRDGMLNVPELGPLQAAGLTFDALRAEIRLRVSQQFIGSDVSITLGELRSVRVFLTGDVLRPGAYQVSAFATMTNVLTLGGGVSENGSLRNIQLKRDGQVVTRLDLYDLLLEGNSSGDVRVANGDVVFVPPVGPRVAVVGEVRRPAIYEFRAGATVAAAVRLAGGGLPSAQLSNVRVERSSPESGLDVFDVDLGSASSARFEVESGDRIVLLGDSMQIDEAISVLGHVYAPGLQQWRPGLRVADVLPSPREVRPNADLGYVLIKRQRRPNGPIEVLSVDLEAIWNGAPHARNVPLLARDGIVVFSKEEGRDVFLAPILDTLRLQSAADAPSRLVSVGGQVRNPGEYPLEDGMTVADLIRAGGGLTESAHRETAELRRYERDDGRRDSTLVDVSLVGIDGRGGPAGPALQPFDHLSVKQVTNWGEDRFLEIKGGVAFPGRYSLSRGETLSSVLERAGGLTDTAFAEGAVFTREILREREREQLDQLSARIESDLATLALSDPGQVDAISVGQSLLGQIRSTEPTGRLVIDMDGIVGGDRRKDILVRDGDALYIPQRSQEVTVIGEVQFATSHLWQEGYDRNDYIDRSGGLTAKADRKRIYVVRASGEVVVAERSRFYGKSGNWDIRAGDTIVVPLKTDRVAPLVLWSSATQAIYNLAIAAAAVASF